MITTEIDFQAPEDLEAAVTALGAYGEEVTVLSGGMSLVPMMNLGLAHPERMISLRRIEDLTDVVDEGDAILVGAMVSHAEVGKSQMITSAASAVSTAAGLIGDVQVRNRGTIGGSVSHADPAADYLPGLAAHEAQVVLCSAEGGQRVVDAKDFFIDAMYTDRRGDELVTGVRIPKMSPSAVSEFIRFARVEGSFAIVNAAVVVDPSGRSTIALGGVGPAPVVLDITDFGADGWREDAARAVGDAVFEACVDVQGDIMSDAEYRRHMAQVHARRVVARAISRLNGSHEPGE